MCNGASVLAVILGREIEAATDGDFESFTHQINLAVCKAQIYRDGWIAARNAGSKGRI